MRSVVRAIGPAALISGGILVGVALATGAARWSLVLIFPVITGTTALFASAVGLLLVGIFFLPLAFAGDNGPESEPPTLLGSNPAPIEGGTGGVIFVGPFPIFFGKWRTRPPIPYRWALALGVAFVVGTVVLLLWGFAGF
ncbi:MAG: DUF131 domain-containing protein [Thermoplasmata archaeon]|nr:DUF131 domain-containing protein [Thermoplasmata archaeon]